MSWCLQAVPVLLGDSAAGFGATSIARLTAAWKEDDQLSRQRDLVDRDYGYVWVDRIHFNIRLKDDRLSTPVSRNELLPASDSFLLS